MSEPFDEPSTREVRGWSPFYRCYRAAGRWTFFAAPAERHVALARVPELRDLAATDTARLEDALAERFAERPLEPWARALILRRAGSAMRRPVRWADHRAQLVVHQRYSGKSGPGPAAHPDREIGAFVGRRVKTLINDHGHFEPRMTSASAEVLTGLFSLAFVAMITPGPNNLVAMSLSVSGNGHDSRQ